MYTPHREDPIYPAKGIKACWRDYSTDCPHRGLTTYLASSSWTIGYAKPYSNSYYATPNEFCKLTDNVWVSINT